MATITKTRDKPMRASPTTSLKGTSLIERLSIRDAGLGLIRYTALSNFLILLILFEMMIDGTSAMGLFQYLQEDTGKPRAVVIGAMMFLVGMDLAQSLRGVNLPHVGWGVMAWMSSQVFFASLAVFYWMTGRASLILVYIHLTPLVLSLAGMIVVLQAAKIPPPAWAARLFGVTPQTKIPMLRLLSLFLSLLGVALIFSPDTAIVRFIQHRYQLAFFGLLLALIAWGAGQLRHNHMNPWRATRRVLGMHLFVFLAFMMFCSQERTISLLSVYQSLSASILGVLFAFMQAQERPSEQAG